MTTEKLQVTQAQALALDDIMQRINDSKEDFGVFKDTSTVLAYYYKGNEFGYDRVAANELSDKDLLTALTVGYEVMETPEMRAANIIDEIILYAEMNNYWISISSTTEEDAAYNKGIIRAINLLEDKGITFTA